VHYTSSSSSIVKHASATLQEDFDLRYQIKRIADKLQMQYTIQQMGRSTTYAFDGVPVMIPRKMLTLACIQAKELCENDEHPGNDVEMVTSNQALLKIRNQIVPNNWPNASEKRSMQNLLKSTCGRKDAKNPNGPQ
jgi:hypothetical protein